MNASITFKTLRKLLRLQLGCRLGDLLSNLLAHLVEVERHEHIANRFGADAGLERILTILFLRLEEILFREKLTGLQRREPWLDHHIVLEIKNTLQILQPHVEQKADARRKRFQEPDVRYRRSQLDVAHAVAAHFRQRHFHATLFADDAFVLHALIFAAKTFIVFDGTKNARTKQTITLRLERTVINRLWFLYFAVRPGKYFLWTCNRDANLVEYLSLHLRAEEIRDLLIHSSLL